jgi:hypothetical protein
MTTKRKSRSCKHGKLKRPVKTKSGKRKCKKSKRKSKSCKYGKLKRKSGKRRCRKSRRKSCKHGKLKKRVKTKSGRVRRCKKKQGSNPYFTFANKHRKDVMKKFKAQGIQGRDLITKTAKELGKMYRAQS